MLPAQRLWHSRFLVLVALEPAHLPRVDFVHVHIRVHHQLVLPDAAGGKGRAKRQKLNWNPQGTAGTIISLAGFAAA